MVTAHGTRMILVAVLVAACLSLAVQTRPVGAQSASEDVIHIPVRWCALKDTTVATNPSVLGEPDTDSILLRRLQRATDRFWLPKANIVFRSAITVDVAPPASFPLIPDPVPPSAGGGGVLGDVSGIMERDAAALSCKQAWDALAPAGVILRGPIVLAVQHLLGTGAPGITTRTKITTSAGTTPAQPGCTDPLDVATATSGYVTVADPSTLGTGIDDATLVAHELGHVLNLGEGNGLDDDGDGAYDTFCDFGELTIPPHSLMNGDVSNATDVLTPRQREDARAVAAKIEGSFTVSSDLMVLPGCVATPDSVKPSESVTVTATGFERPTEPVRLDLGDEPLASGELDASDAVDIDLTVPLGALPGTRLLTIAVEASGLTAHCLIHVAA